MMDLEWRPMAMDDRMAILDYIALDNPTAAILLDEKFEEKAELACQNPKLYKPGRVTGTREIVVSSNYIMIYRINGKILEILRVLNTAQQWP